MMKTTVLALTLSVALAGASGDKIEPGLQARMAVTLDAAGDRDGTAEFHDGLAESAPSWDCAALGNLVCGKSTPATVSVLAVVLAGVGVGR